MILQKRHVLEQCSKKSKVKKHKNKKFKKFSKNITKLEMKLTRKNK